MATWIQFAALSPSLHRVSSRRKKKRERERERREKRKEKEMKEKREGEESWKRKIQFTRNRVTAFGSINFSFLPLSSLLSPPHQRRYRVMLSFFSPFFSRIEKISLESHSKWTPTKDISECCGFSIKQKRN